MLFNKEPEVVRLGSELLRDPELLAALQQARLFDTVFHDGASKIVGVCACAAEAVGNPVAMLLAALLQERSEQPVLLVEADLRNPSLAEELGVSGPGFEAFAAGQLNLETLPTFPGTETRVMTAEVTAKPMVVLKQALSRLEELRATYGQVVVSLPPVLSSPDVALLGPRIDGVVLVVEAESTRWQVAKEAKKSLDSAGVEVFGAVLNNKAYHIPDWLYRLL